MAYLINLFKILLYKIKKEKIIVINEAAGLGDYIWVRSYFKLIKNNEKYKDHKIFMLTTKRWTDFAKDFDSEYVDMFLPFKDPYAPKFAELLPLRLINADIFINFRANQNYWDKINNTVNAQIIIDNQNITNKEGFYSERYNAIISQLLPIPSDWHHSLNYKTKVKKDYGDYILLVLSGYTEGKLTLHQLKIIINELLKKYNYPIMLLGQKKDSKTYNTLATAGLKAHLINGCNKFKTYELPYIVDKAKLVITPNTSTLHMAILLNKKTLCFNSSMKHLYQSENITYITSSERISTINDDTIIEAIQKF